MRRRYRFVGRHNGRYHWERPAHDGLVEQVSCSVEWFWRPASI
jgi:hypothetical protein